MKMTRPSRPGVPSSLKHVVGPLLFSIYPVTFLYAHNINSLSLQQLTRPLILAVLLAGLVFAVCRLVLKDDAKASLTTTLFMLLFWNYDFLFKGMNSILSLNHWHILPLLLFIYGHLVCFVGSSHKRSSIENANRATLIMGFLLIAFNLFTLVPTEARKHRIRSMKPAHQNASREQIPQESYPDIYLIILDEYARPDTMKEEWGYDNDGFFIFLKGKGFFIADKSQSPYIGTNQVIASLMNLKYVDKDLTTSELYRIINDSSLFACLNKAGFKIVYLDGYSRPEHELSNQNVVHEYIMDLDIENAPRFDEFSDLIIKKTFFNPLVEGQGGANLWYSANRFYLDYLDDFPSLANATHQPVLLFAHLPCPHLPFVFDRAGNFSKNPTNYWEYMSLNKKVLKSLYLEQYIYVTKRITSAVDRILKTSIDQPVIILMSDHGPRKVSAGVADPVQHHRVLNAIYFPDGDYSDLNAGVTPVDALRVVFSRYFKSNAEMKRSGAKN